MSRHGVGRQAMAGAILKPDLRADFVGGAGEDGGRQGGVTNSSPFGLGTPKTITEVC